MRSRYEFVVPPGARRRLMRFQVCGLAIILALLTALIVLDPAGPGADDHGQSGIGPQSAAAVQAGSVGGEAP